MFKPVSFHQIQEIIYDPTKPKSPATLDAETHNDRIRHQRTAAEKWKMKKAEFEALLWMATAGEVALEFGGSAMTYSLFADDLARVGKTIVHHIASNKHLSRYTPKFEAIAKKYGLKLNDDWNKVEISNVYHYYRHPNQYHDFVLDGMMRADMGAGGSQTRFLQLFDEYVKQPLLKNPNMLNKTGWQ